MVLVKFFTPEYDGDKGHVNVLRATVRAEDGKEAEIQGDGEWKEAAAGFLDVPVINEDGNRLRYEDGHEAWAKSIHLAFRSGDIFAVAEEIPGTSLP